MTLLSNRVHTHTHTPPHHTCTHADTECFYISTLRGVQCTNSDSSSSCLSTPTQSNTVKEMLWATSSYHRVLLLQLSDDTNRFDSVNPVEAFICLRWRQNQVFICSPTFNIWWFQFYMKDEDLLFFLSSVSVGILVGWNKQCRVKSQFSGSGKPCCV